MHTNDTRNTQSGNRSIITEIPNSSNLPISSNILDMEKLAKKRRKATPLRKIDETTNVRMPGANAIRAQFQSFGPATISTSLLEFIKNSPLQDFCILTPNGASIEVKGLSNGERIALRRYTTKISGAVCAKYLAVCFELAAQCTGSQTKEKVVVSTSQFLDHAGYSPRKAKGKEKHEELAHFLLYLARSHVTVKEKQWEEEGSKGGKGHKIVRKVEYKPLLLLEGITAKNDGTLEIAEEIRFSFTSKYADLLYGERGLRYFCLPVKALLGFHAKHEKEEILLACYLTSMLYQGGYSNRRFHEMAYKTALLSIEDMADGHNRVRDAEIILYAMLNVVNHGFVDYTHTLIDRIVAVDILLKSPQVTNLSKTMLERVKKTEAYQTLSNVDEGTQIAQRREAYQDLLHPSEQVETIKFRPGKATRELVKKRTTQKADAIDKAKKRQARMEELRAQRKAAT